MILDATIEFLVPEIADYELRRELIRQVATKAEVSKSIDRLNDLIDNFGYVPLDTPTVRLAAEIWAKARNEGLPTADSSALDGDVLLAAQAIRLGATVLTLNRKHLERYVTTKSPGDLGLNNT